MGKSKRRGSRLKSALLLLILFLPFQNCGGGFQSADPTAEDAGGATSLASKNPRSTPTPVASPTPALTPTPSPTPAPTATPSGTPKPTATPAPTATPTPTPSPTPAPTPAPTAGFQNIIPSVFTLTSGQVRTVDGVSLKITAGGDLQVTNAQGTVLWHTNTSASCSAAGSCNLTMQADGNLVLYTPSGAVWSTQTWNQNGAHAVFSSQAAYLSVRDANYKVIWTSGGTAPNALLRSSQDSSTAKPVSRFLDSLAVNVHMDQYEQDVNVVLSKLNFLGIKNIRDNYRSSLHANYLKLGQSGIKMNMLISASDMNSALTQSETLFDNSAGGLVGLEGPNEINNFPFSCNGSTWAGGWPNDNGPSAQCFMTNFYRLIKGSAKVKNVPVFNLTGNTSARNAETYGLLSLDSQADYGNIHVYPSGQPRGALLRELASTYLSVLPSKAMITEFGYTTSGTGAVSAKAQALMVMNGYLDAFQHGFVRTYVYELTDNQWEGHGFFDTSGKAKPVANALHNLTTILADSGTGSPGGTLNYTFASLPPTVYSQLLQKSDGRFYLILWNEAQVANGTNDVAVTPSALSLNLGRTFSQVKVYDPVNSATATQTLTSASALNLNLGASALVVEMVP